MNRLAIVGSAETLDDAGGIVEAEPADNGAHRPAEIELPHVAATIGGGRMDILHLLPEEVERFTASAALGGEVGEAKAELPVWADWPIVTGEPDVVQSGERFID